MAWVESHQELRNHPKVVRLALRLGVNQWEAIGRLHGLWWWALDHAENGDISDFDAVDIAAACDWHGDAELLLKALIECGPGNRAGFIEEHEGRWVLHNWWEYAGKLVARREEDRQRKRAGRSGAGRETSESNPTDVHGTSNGHPPDVSRNPTQPNQTSSSAERRLDVDALCDLLASLVEKNTNKRPSVSAKWRDEARLLLDRDKRDIDEVQRVMRWACNDSFWRSNILSMPKFREKYDQLKLKSGIAKPAADDAYDDFINGR